MLKAYLTDYTRYCGTRVYRIALFWKEKTTFCDHTIQNVIVSNEASFAIGNLLPRRRAIPALSNNTESDDLPASRRDKQWKT